MRNSDSAEIIAQHSRRMAESLSFVVKNKQEFAETSSIFPNWFFEEVKLRCRSWRHLIGYERDCLN